MNRRQKKKLKKRTNVFGDVMSYKELKEIVRFAKACSKYFYGIKG